MSFNEFVAFVKSASAHLSLSKDQIFDIMMMSSDGDGDAAYIKYGSDYSAVIDAQNIWNDAKRFVRGE